MRSRRLRRGSLGAAPSIVIAKARRRGRWAKELAAVASRLADPDRGIKSAAQSALERVETGLALAVTVTVDALGLRLEDNQLEGPIPAEWANLGNLEELSFGGNRGMDELRDDWIAGRLPHCLVTF